MADVGKPSTSGSFALHIPSQLKMTVTDGPCAGQIFNSGSVNKYFLTVGRVGRSKKATISFKDSSVSEKHAELAWDGTSGAWIVRDTGSSNGTRVNGALLKPYRARMLKFGDHVTFGTQTIATVEFEEVRCSDITVEDLLRAHFESQCQALEAASTRAADEVWQQSNEAMNALLGEPLAA